MTKTCAIIGCSPMCFPWGFDEEDEGCAALKLILMNRISKLIGEGYTRFAVSMDSGVGLYAAEIIYGLKDTNEELEVICYTPFEEQATKWINDFVSIVVQSLRVDAVLLAAHQGLATEFQ